jgi:hypothetical protein
MHVEGHLRRKRFLVKMLGSDHLDQKKNGVAGDFGWPATFFLPGRENYVEGEDFARKRSSAAALGKACREVAEGMVALHRRCASFCLLLLSGTDWGRISRLRLLCRV